MVAENMKWAESLPMFEILYFQYRVSSESQEMAKSELELTKQNYHVCAIYRDLKPFSLRPEHHYSAMI